MRTNGDVDMIVLVPAHISKTTSSSIELRSVLENVEGNQDLHIRDEADGTNFFNNIAVSWKVGVELFCDLMKL